MHQRKSKRPSKLCSQDRLVCHSFNI